MIQKRQSLSELKVGIFVVVSCLLLAIAIFAIGSQVGLFEDQFLAVTYLSNVSGLKPGDIVLLGGVEIGNVDSVRITLEPGELPETEQNARTLVEIAQLQNELSGLPERISQTQSTGNDLAQQLETAMTQYGPDSREVRRLQGRIEDTQALLEDLQDKQIDVEDELVQARRKLQNIQILMKINSSYRYWIRSDSSIALGSIGLLGDKYIEISLGRTADPPLTVEIPVDTFFGSSREEVVLIAGTQQASFQELITSTNDILANFETLSRKVQDVFDRFQQGEGTIGKFFNDPTFYNSLDSTVQNANLAMERAAELMEELTQGEGTIGRLVEQRELYDNMVAATFSLKELLARIDEGEGTLGKLTTDSALYDRADEVMADIGSITDRMNQGEGTLGKLSTDEALYTSLRASLDKFAAFVQDIEQGRGTLGRLAQDETLYSSVDQLASELVKLIYDFRQDPKRFLTIKFEIF